MVTFFPYYVLFPAFILLIIETRNEKSMKYYIIPAGVLGLITAYCAFGWAQAQGPLFIGLKQRIAIGAPFLLMMYTSLKLHRLRKK